MGCRCRNARCANSLAGVERELGRDSWKWLLLVAAARLVRALARLLGVRQRVLLLLLLASRVVKALLVDSVRQVGVGQRVERVRVRARDRRRARRVGRAAARDGRRAAVGTLLLDYGRRR